jgi:hypothetical protein
MVVHTVTTLVPSQDEVNTYIIPIINDELYVQTGILLHIRKRVAYVYDCKSNKMSQLSEV